MSQNCFCVYATGNTYRILTKLLEEKKAPSPEGIPYLLFVFLWSCCTLAAQAVRNLDPNLHREDDNWADGSRATNPLLNKGTAPLERPNLQYIAPRVNHPQCPTYLAEIAPIPRDSPNEIEKCPEVLLPTGKLFPCQQLSQLLKTKFDPSEPTC